jgi:hypothetical protein
MAIIYSYPQATAQLTDLVLGNRMTEEGSSTRSFSIADIVTLAGGNISNGGYVPYVGANASVQLGNNSLIINGGGTTTNISPTLGLTIISGNRYATVSKNLIVVGDQLAETYAALEYNGTLTLASAVGEGVLSAGDLTSVVTLNYPNKASGDYTIATTVDLVPYKAFTFLATQTGTTFTNATVTSIANALGTYTASYVSTGTYRITFVTALNTNAISLQTNSIYKTVGGNSYLMVITKPSTNIIEIKTYDATSGSLINGVLSNYIEIRSYN